MAGEATLDLVVVGIAEPVPGVRSFRLAAADGRELPAFVPGSHLIVDCGGEDGGRRTNAYSLTSAGFAPTVYEISVLRVEGGNGGSRWLHTHLELGSRMTARPPRSGFPPIARASRHLLVAGGIGVTPIVSHLRAAARRGQDRRVLYVHRAGRGAHLDDVHGLTDGRAGIFTDRATFAARLEEALVDQPLGTHLYVCGPGPLIDRVVGSARRFGWPGSRIHVEHFGVGTTDPGEPFEVVLTRSGRTVRVPSGTSLLEALEAAGIAIPNRCRHGVCGECRTPVTGGPPLHRDLFLTVAEKAAADCLMPCVSRASGPRLEVPL
ncbi:PDR/VanB family oxidoreductase [Pseudofrankia inefficax]|uniref:Ferredoxin n=1 Tax=Pseudofrankia inefficax (strain DSM 45817 / CECT 9037 / DDB 130130 / EuI1c) TaxID=298654 RepID=E3JB11_PSEI1|nr:PDR/VanB family oxidoreductase [Pseudofrankia inefficax]ADP84632.1 ferredoxin [Pseudofrankia inefficax]